MHRWSLGLLLVIASSAAAQAPLLEDPAGDVEVYSYGQSIDDGGQYPNVDLRSLEVIEGPDLFTFIVAMEGMPRCQQETCPDAGDVRTYFQYGDLRYYVQQGIDVDGNAYGELHFVEDGAINGPAVERGLSATIDSKRAATLVEVPRSLLVDEAGTPPIKGRSLTDILTRSYSQTSFGGPDFTGSGDTDMLVVRDLMGEGGSTELAIQTGGSDFQGDLRLSSPAPYRASNGGATTLTYEATLSNVGGQDLNATVEATGAPEDWNVTWPAKTWALAPGQNVTVWILVQTPSGHQHGGTDTFRLHASAGDHEANLDMGIHYLSIPQPAGHHPRLYLHTLHDGAFGTANSAFGSDDGRIWMNTLGQDPGDEQTPIVAQEGFAGFQAQTSRWSVCLIPNLRLGLDFDLDRTGTFTVDLGATAPHQGVELTGELLHVAGPDPLNFCDPRLYQDRETMVLAHLDGGPSHDLVASEATFDLTVTPTTEADYVPYEDGAHLVLELTATFTGGDPTHGGLRLMPGGEMTLPLDEYRDARPGGLVGGPVVTGNGTAPGAEPEGPEKESGLPWPLALMAFVVAWRRRAQAWNGA